jgi:uncharacterized repeat protein (TIGR03803 family)
MLAGNVGSRRSQKSGVCLVQVVTCRRDRISATSVRAVAMRLKILLLALVISSSLVAQSQRNFRVLHAFGVGHDGAGVWDSVAFDKRGNLYGTTGGGGNYGYGTVFELSPEQTGRWKESLLASFKPLDPRGAEPSGGLVLDSADNLYGTTQRGGKYGGGTAFELTFGHGAWVFRVIHHFGGHGDPSCCPWANLIMDNHSDLYGTGYAAFEFSPGSRGWTESILHEFTGKNGDGLGPQAGPIRDAAGNLYGTTVYGGGSKECGAGCGIAWKLSPPVPDGGSGTQGWTERILHRFGFGHDGGFPGPGQLAVDREGNLYGTTQSGGPRRAGTVFKLTHPPTPGGGWTETILHGFGEDQDGYLPTGGVIFDKIGNLYGTTGVGGSYGEGVVYKLSPQVDGRWKYTLLHTFNGYDGAEPVANLTFGADGKLYGTTATGGTYGGGVVFQLAP